MRTLHNIVCDAINELQRNKKNLLFKLPIEDSDGSKYTMVIIRGHHASIQEYFAKPKVVAK